MHRLGVPAESQALRCCPGEILLRPPSPARRESNISTSGNMLQQGYAALMNTAQQLLPGINWFDVSEPNSPDLDELARRFHLHELQIEDCRHRPQRAKVDEYGAYLFAVLKHMVRGEQGSAFDDFDTFLGPDFLITVHQGECPFLAKLCARVQQNHVVRLDRILYEITDLIVDEYLALLDESADDISKVESVVLQHPEPEVLRQIFHLKRRLIDFRRSASGMR